MRALTLALLACVLGACSAIVSPENDPIRCETTLGDMCPTGSVCHDGFCVDPSTVPACVPAVPPTEQCNGRDDDCNGVVDDGADADQDGFTWCGGGDRDFADCDDGDPSTHPAGNGQAAAPEACDGHDNDCDGTVDETVDGPLCTAPGTECISSVGLCLVPDCTVPGHLCATNDLCVVAPDHSWQCLTNGGCGLSNPCEIPERCNPVTHECFNYELDLGDACTADVECGSGACIESAALRLTGAPPRICGAACCSDADCAVYGGVCWASGSGARSCVLPDAILRTPPLGTKATWEVCASDQECASGVCEGHCLAACTSETQCPAASSTTCAAATMNDGGRPDLTAYACVAPAGTLEPGEICTMASDCRSGLCLNLGIGGGLGIEICTKSCGSSGDCAGFPGIDAYCGYAYMDSDLIGARDFLPLCIPQISESRDRTTGASCTSDQDCFDGACETNVCADTCCTDATCGGSAKCRPTRSGSLWAMRCMPNSGS